MAGPPEWRALREQIVGLGEHSARKNYYPELQRRILELQRAEEKFRAVFEGVNDAILIHDLETGQILDVNPRVCELWGCTREEAVRLQVGDLSSGVGAYTQDEAMRRIAQAALGTPQVCEWHARRRDGSLFWIEFTMRRACIGRTDCVLVVARDLSERRRLEESLRQAQKLEAIGKLAGGIAHDFNNLLTSILGNLDLATTEDVSRPLKAECLAEAVKAAELAAKLTQQLLAFSRKQVMEFRPTDLDGLLADTEGILRRILGEDVVLVIHRATALGPCRADRTQVQQVIINLAVNARDAMPDGGVLTIQTSNLDRGALGGANLPALGPGDYVCLSVSDTGSGLSPEARDHLFEPFFTTKATGKGTGLGLATVYGIVCQHNGVIDVHSQPGKGTTFRVFFPRLAAETVSESSERTTPAVGGGETVLFVEDEPSVRQVGTALLSRLGYQVLPCVGGEDALAVASSTPGPIHLLLTDVIMPGIPVQDLVTRLATLRPATRVLFTSGHGAEVIARHGVLKDGVAFLPKPYTRESLARKVREVLDRGNHGETTAAGR